MYITLHKGNLEEGAMFKLFMYWFYGASTSWSLVWYLIFVHWRKKTHLHRFSVHWRKKTHLRRFFTGVYKEGLFNSWRGRIFHSLNFVIFIRYFLHGVAYFPGPKFGRKNSVTRLFAIGKKRYSCFWKMSNTWNLHKQHYFTRLILGTSISPVLLAEALSAPHLLTAVRH